MESESLDPDTAPAKLSIWKGIDRTALERQTQALSARQYVAGSRSYTDPSTSKDDGSYPLPIEVEKSLADDFAFIAACQPQVDFVSAVTIEQDPKRHLFVIKLAANQGVAVNVKEKFDEILTMLRKRAMKNIARDACQDQLLELIVQLNCNRLLGRLGSTKFIPPAHLVKIREPLPVRLRKLFRSNIKVAKRRQKCPDVDELDQHISNFEVAFAQLESGNAADNVLNLVRTIKHAFDMTGNGVNLPNRLRALGCPERLLDTRDVREVGKIANYWRISRHLTICSSRFRSCFERAELHPVPRYRASQSSKVVPRQFVHAEIQLLVHYEIQGNLALPRAIGVSKEACFLCDSFLRAHGRFSFTGAHRQIFPQWTVPDLAEYTASTVKHFRRILTQVALDVKQEHLKAQKKLHWQPFPLQSAINLNVVHLTMPSTSTLPMQPSVHSSGVARIVSSSSGTTKSMSFLATHGAFVHERHSEDTGREIRPSASSIAESQEPSDSDKEVLQDVSLKVEINEVDNRLVDWIRTFAYFSGLPIDKSLISRRKRFAGGSISLEPAHEYEQGRIIHVVDIPTEDDLVLVKGFDDGNEDSDEMSFVLVGEKGQSVRFRCRWHAS